MLGYDRQARAADLGYCVLDLDFELPNSRKEDVSVSILSEFSSSQLPYRRLMSKDVSSYGSISSRIDCDGALPPLFLTSMWIEL